MMLNELTEHLELLTTTHTKRSASGRGSGNKLELTGIKKLRALILELAVRGKLVPQNPEDEPASVLLEKIATEKDRLVAEGKIKRQKPLSAISDVEKPFDLPAGWEWTYLNESIDVRDGTHDSPKDATGSNTFALVTSKNFLDGKIDFAGARRISAEDHFEIGKRSGVELYNILFSMIGGNIGNQVMVMDERQFSIKNVALFKYYNKDFTAPHYVFLFTQNLAKGLQVKAVGGAQPFVSLGALRKLIFPLPPIKEQHRIVAKVDELMALCDQLEQEETDNIAAHQTLVVAMLTTLTDSKNAAELAENWSLVAEHFDTLFTTEASITRLRQTILQLAVMGRLVQQNPEDEPASKLLELITKEKTRLIAEKRVARQKPLPTMTDEEMPFELPVGWSWARLEDVVDIQGGITKGRKLAGRKLVSVPYLRVANVQRGHLILEEIKEVEIPVEEHDKYQVKARDLLITEGGDWDKVGRTAIWSDELPYMAHQNHVFKARIFLQEQSELWLERYLNGPVARQYFAKSSKQTTNLASINKTQLRGCPIAIPPTAEKNRIVTRLNELMTLCDTLQQQIQQAQATQQQLASTLVEQAITTHNQPDDSQKVG